MVFGQGDNDSASHNGLLKVKRDCRLHAVSHLASRGSAMERDQQGVWRQAIQHVYKYTSRGSSAIERRVYTASVVGSISILCNQICFKKDSLFGRAFKIYAQSNNPRGNYQDVVAPQITG
jgi:hypothetical protein